METATAGSPVYAMIYQSGMEKTLSSDQAIDQNDSKRLAQIADADAKSGISANKVVREKLVTATIAACDGSVAGSRRQAKAAESTPSSLKQLLKDAEKERQRKSSKGTVKRRKRAAARIRRQLALEELKKNHPQKLRKKTTRPTFGCGHRRCPNPPPTRYVPSEHEELEAAA